MYLESDVTREIVSRKCDVTVVSRQLVTREIVTWKWEIVSQQCDITGEIVIRLCDVTREIVIGLCDVTRESPNYK
mgnify:CR=1 FL=1